MIRYDDKGRVDRSVNHGFACNERWYERASCDELADALDVANAELARERQANDMIAKERDAFQQKASRLEIELVGARSDLATLCERHREELATARRECERLRYVLTSADDIREQYVRRLESNGQSCLTPSVIEYDKRRAALAATEGKSE